MRPSLLLLAASPASELEAALHREALRWAQSLAPGRVQVAAGDLAGAAAGAFAPGEPLVVLWPELPVMRPELAAGMLEDLASGCELVLGPLFDGSLYLLALARPIDSLLAIDWRAADAMAGGFAHAAGAGLEIGLLRAERGLRGPGDAQAALADPCLPAEIGQILR